MKKAEVVFIPSSGIGHLVPTIQFAKTLQAQAQAQAHADLSITILTFPTPTSPIPPALTDSHSLPRFRFIQLTPPPVHSDSDSPQPTTTDLAHRVISESTQVPLAALVVDMFTTEFIHVAHQLGLPAYVFYSSGASMLGLALHCPVLDSDLLDHEPCEFAIPSFPNSVPLEALPSVLWRRDHERRGEFLEHCRRLGEVRGIIVNSFNNFESYAIDALSKGCRTRDQRVYPVGPVLDLVGRAYSDTAQESENVVEWLDKQPPRSVVFLCFGSKGTLEAAQAKEIARALERSGYPFLWSVRSSNGSTRFEEFLPDGFLARTAEWGMVVCGWVPQAAVLGHGSVGCFVSHCGWNSTLESVWFGVPILTWPMYAEQHLNAFLLSRELGLVVELKGYCRGADEFIWASEIERGLKRVMEGKSSGEVRRRVEEMKEKSRRAVMEGGSSFVSMKRLIEDLIVKL